MTPSHGQVTLCAAVLLVSGCAHSTDESFSPATMGRTAVASPLSRNETSTYATEAKLKRQDLLYVSAFNPSYVDVFTYPGGKLVQTLKGFLSASGMCTDNQSNVYITDYNGDDTLEYAHGASHASAVLVDEPYSYPTSCSVDPTTGDVAVINAYDNSRRGNGYSEAVIYKAGHSKISHVYRRLPLLVGEGTYDGAGNIFVVGDGPGWAPALAELPKGSNMFSFIQLPEHVKQDIGNGTLAWDGRYLALSDFVANRVWRLSVTGNTAHAIRSMKLADAGGLAQFIIVGKGQHQVLIGANDLEANAKVWKYPQGGWSINTFPNVIGAGGVALSLATK